jgi:hypothetical protein
MTTSTAEEQDSATITLSIGGVEFCLTPSTTPPHHANSFSNNVPRPPSPTMSISKVGNDEAVIDFNGFVGTLHVVTKKHANSARSMWDFLNKGSNTSAMTTPSVNALSLPASTTTTTNENDEDLLTYDNGNMADMLQMEDTSSRIVEDTPSPTIKKKKGDNDDEMKSDDDEKMMMTTGAKKKKKTKGQQKLSFFDSKGKKNTNKQQGSNKKVCLSLESNMYVY